MKNRNLVEIIVELAFSVTFLVLFVLLMISSVLHWSETFNASVIILLLLLSLIATFYPLLKKGRTSFPVLLVVVGCFVLDIISLIFFTSEMAEKYKEASIQISASCVGGMIALYGIGLTIKFNRLDKEKSDIEKAKPNIFPISQKTWSALASQTGIERDIELRIDLSDVEITKRNESYYSFSPIYLANSDLSMCTFKGIIINDEESIVFQYDNVMLKGSYNCFSIDCCFKLGKDIKSIQFVLGDMLGNVYGCYMSFDIEKKSNRNKMLINVMGTLKTKKLNTNRFLVFEQIK